MNLFGFDISELDLANFVAAMRLVTIGVVTISFLLFFRQKRWTILAMGIAVLVVVGWLTTFYPLARIYGLQAPGDRLRNLSWVASVAAGNSPLSTGWVGDLTLEPLWALVAGGLCFGHPEFAPVVYALVSLVIPLMLGLVLFLHFRRREDEESGSELRALVVVAFALLVSSGPLDYLAPFRDFYAKNFFLKPNHTLGFVFIPLLIGGIASRRKLWLGKGSGSPVTPRLDVYRSLGVFLLWARHLPRFAFSPTEEELWRRAPERADSLDIERHRGCPLHFHHLSTAPPCHPHRLHGGRSRGALPKRLG